MIRCVYLTVFAWLLTIPSFGQKNNIRKEIRARQQAPKHYLPLSLSIRGGNTQFWGELRSQNLNHQFGGGLYYHLKNAEAFSFGMEGHKGRLSGTKKPYFNSRFLTEYHTAEIVSRWDIIRGITWDQEVKWSLQVYTGIGLSVFSAEAFDLDTGGLLRYTNDIANSGRTALFKKYGGPIRKMGISHTNERIIPVGLTPGYRLSHQLSIGIDLRLLFVRTDKLDATSGYSLNNAEEEASYSNTPNDIYTTATIFLNYRLMKKK